jgi:hypothetical protein
MIYKYVKLSLCFTTVSLILADKRRGCVLKSILCHATNFTWLITKNVRILAIEAKWIALHMRQLLQHMCAACCVSLVPCFVLDLIVSSVVWQFACGRRTLAILRYEPWELYVQVCTLTYLQTLFANSLLTVLLNDWRNHRRSWWTFSNRNRGMEIMFLFFCKHNMKLVSEILSEWQQPIFKLLCKLLVGIKFQRIFYCPFVFEVAHDRLMMCFETCPHLQTLNLAFHLQREARNTDIYLRDVCKRTNFLQNLCRQCLYLSTRDGCWV